MLALPRIGSLCSGYGGLDMAVMSVLGGRVVWHCEVDLDASRVLAHHWPDVPNLGDLKAVDWDQIEPVDVLTAGYPCQPESDAGHRRSIEDERWIWPAIADAVRHLRPRLVVLENVRGHVGRGMPTVLGDLAGIGYDAVWDCVRASDIGAPHRRKRVFILASPADAGRYARPEVDADWAAAAGCGGDAAHTGGEARWSGDALARDGGAPHGPGEAPESGRRDSAPTDPAVIGEENEPWYDDPLPLGAEPGAGRGDRPGQDAPGVAELGRGADLVDWGRYTAAIDRWTRILGRPAPAPAITGRHGGAVLNPELPEWMLGLPDGWVTAVPGLSRSAQLRILGNGVCPQQADLALRLLLTA